MLLKHLTLTQFRAFEQASFDFQRGMNLIVGINGVGKSSVLEALRVVLLAALPKFTASKARALPFKDSDITQGRSTLTVELDFEVENIPLTYFVHQYRENYGERVIPLSEEELQQPGLGRQERINLRRDQQEVHELPEKNEFIPDEKMVPRHLKKAGSQPIAVYFSTRRSLSNRKNPNNPGGQSAAFSEALAVDRELQPREFAEWWLVQEALSEESGDPQFERYLDGLKTTVTTFLKTSTGLSAVREPETTLVLHKGDASLDIYQLSDGERGILALVLDLTRRLYWANPSLENPLTDGKAVVLIDELDLHLHPRWQRSVVEKLTATFPNCQFIATTHSPQIIGEVPPENILILESGEPPYQPDQSLGMDSNWILKYIMDASERKPETEKVLKKIAQLIEEEEYKKATEKIDELSSELGEFPELVRLQTRIDRIRILGK